MKRPFKDKRLVGPFVSSDKFTKLGFRPEDEKEVVGVSGTPFPNYDKEELLVIYVLEGDHLAMARQIEKDVKNKINSRGEFDRFGVRFLKSGKSSTKQFKEQAVLVKVPKESIAITESSLQRIEDIIVRSAKSTHDMDVSVKERIYEMEGKP